MIIVVLLCEEVGYELIVVLGNVGIVVELGVEMVGFDFFNGKLVVEYVVGNGIELVVVGFEVLFVVGVVDVL